MSSRSEGDTDGQIEFHIWLVLNVALATVVGGIYALVTGWFILYPYALAGGPDKLHHLVLWFAGYVAISGVVSSIVVKRRIIGSMVVWAIMAVLFWLVAIFLSS